MTKKDFTGDINFLYEMGNIRLIDRMWRRFGNDGVANLAEHHFRVFWLAMVIATNEGGDIDTGKIAKLSLMHDITESRVTEVDYISRQYVDRKEQLAINDMLEDTSLKEEYLELWQEYENKTTIEAKIVKDADMLDIDFELAEQAARGYSIKEAKHETRQRASEKLYTQTAKDMFKQLADANPHDWWRTSPRNRMNAGDWKPDPTK